MAKRAQKRLVKIGGRRFTIKGGRQPDFRDLYHLSLSISWPRFFGLVTLSFLTINLIFAVLYWLGGDDVANSGTGSLVLLFFFSVEALSTVGFGDMHPLTTYGHMIASIESFVGILFIAVTTGLMFTRFALARARFMFARHPVVSHLNGYPTLMVRIANERHNTVSDASARMWVLMQEKSAEGHSFHRFVELTLERYDNPVFVLSWTVMHVIDETSPLHASMTGHTKTIVSMIISIRGYDENMAQEVRARHWYDYTDVRWNQRYVDIMEPNTDGTTQLNYDKFHEMHPDGEGPSAPG